MSEFEKKIFEFKEKIKVAKNLSELTKISSEIFGKNICLLSSHVACGCVARASYEQE